MARKKREKSVLGIYHIMIRGINKHHIFFDDDDYMTMMRVLGDAHLKIVGHYSNQINVQSENECKILSFACMPNHVHILLKEGEANVSQIMKKIQDRFVFFYNKKYDRCGHLFQDRFRSEPVNDEKYFRTLLRYINRNPVKGMLCNKPEEYMYSSWRELIGDGSSAVVKVCDRDYVMNCIRQDEMIEWVNMDIDDECMDMDDERFVKTDKHALDILKDISGAESAEDFKDLAPDLQMKYVIEAINSGVSMRQASRLSLMTYAQIRKEITLIKAANSHRNPNRGVRPLGLDFDADFNNIDTLDKEKFYLETNARLRGLSPENKIIQLIKNSDSMSLNDLSKASELTVYSCRKVIQLLERQNVIYKQGTGRSTKWFVNE